MPTAKVTHAVHRIHLLYRSTSDPYTARILPPMSVQLEVLASHFARQQLAHRLEGVLVWLVCLALSPAAREPLRAVTYLSQRQIQEPSRDSSSPPNDSDLG